LWQGGISFGGVYLFKAVGIPDPPRPMMIVHTTFSWDHTTVLNIIALAGFAVLYRLYRGRDATGTQRYAKDPVCGMQVEIAHAPAARIHDGTSVYFGSDHCAHRFDSDPGRFADPRSTNDSHGADHEHH
jgi:uncharacterized protein